MEEQYAVMLHGYPVGKVLVNKQGLYYCFHCRCRLEGENIYRLRVTCGTVSENLGILVPQGSSFVLDTRKPVKQIGEGKLLFTLCPKQDRPQSPAPTVFIPISPEEPFAYISRLRESFLAFRDGQPGICIKEMQEC